MHKKGIKEIVARWWKKATSEQSESSNNNKFIWVLEVTLCGTGRFIGDRHSICNVKYVLLYNVWHRIVFFLIMFSGSFPLSFTKYSMKVGWGGKKLWLKSVNKFHKVVSSLWSTCMLNQYRSTWEWYCLNGDVFGEINRNGWKIYLADLAHSCLKGGFDKEIMSLSNAIIQSCHVGSKVSQIDKWIILYVKLISQSTMCTS